MWVHVKVAISLSKRMDQTHFFVVWGSLHLHNKLVTLPALPVPIMEKCLTQGHNMLAATGLKPQPFVYEPNTGPLDHMHPHNDDEWIKFKPWITSHSILTFACTWEVKIAPH